MRCPHCGKKMKVKSWDASSITYCCDICNYKWGKAGSPFGHLSTIQQNELYTDIGLDDYDDLREIEEEKFYPKYIPKVELDDVYFGYIDPEKYKL